MNNCYGCKYYDDSVDACNADDLCIMDVVDSVINEFKSYLRDYCVDECAVDMAAKRLKENYCNE